MKQDHFDIESNLDSLPRLLYIGDCPVAFAMSGSILLYRMFDQYPEGKLKIVERGSELAPADKRLRDVDYRLWKCGLPKRFNRVPIWREYTQLNAYKAVTKPDRDLDDEIDQFDPEAVITVAHGLGLRRAHQISRERDIPLHLIVHDRWLDTLQMPQQMYEGLDREFAQIYGDAASRLCASPYMDQYYRESLGIAGQTLYPCRSRFAATYNEAPKRENREKLIVAFAGAIAYVDEIRAMAQLLCKAGAEFRIYGVLSPEDQQQMGLDLPCVKNLPAIPSNELIETLRNEADILYLPMSFDPAREINMRIGFPSKLTDYTATGLPILVHGPEYCSAVRWAKSNETGEIVTSKDSADLEAAYQKLTDSDRRQLLGANALQFGNDSFSWQSARVKLYRTLIENSKVPSVS